MNHVSYLYEDYSTKIFARTKRTYIEKSYRKIIQISFVLRQSKIARFLQGSIIIIIIIIIIMSRSHAAIGATLHY
jgi:hypothetical protein